MNHGQFSFFTAEKRFEKIQKLNPFLSQLDAIVDWEIFRSDLEKVRNKERKSNAGRPPYDVVLMFKILVLRHLYNLSYDKIEEQILDRASWTNFLGLSFAHDMPDAKTIWLFAEQLKNMGLEADLFDRFHEELERQGFEAKGGIIVDSTFVEVPKQRNTKDENEQIKNGMVPESFAANPNILEQKDLDARWTQKGDETFFGYKDHVASDVRYKLIRGFGVTDAAVHDVNRFEDLVPETSAYPDEPYYVDAGYVSKEREEKLRQRGYNPLVCERLPKNRPLLVSEVKESNRMKSKIRCRIEHIFGEMKMRMGDETLRVIGFARARFSIGMRNLVYNMSRLVSLKRIKAT